MAVSSKLCAFVIVGVFVVIIIIVLAIQFSGSETLQNFYSNSTYENEVNSTRTINVAGIGVS